MASGRAIILSDVATAAAYNYQRALISANGSEVAKAAEKEHGLRSPTWSEVNLHLQIG